MQTPNEQKEYEWQKIIPGYCRQQLKILKDRIARAELQVSDPGEHAVNRSEYWKMELENATNELSKANEFLPEVIAIFEKDI